MKKHRLTIIDDDRDMLDLLTYNLLTEGYEVKAFFNAVDALKYVTTDNTDLVITAEEISASTGRDALPAR